MADLGWRKLSHTRPSDCVKGAALPVPGWGRDSPVTGEQCGGILQGEEELRQERGALVTTQTQGG